MRELLLLPCLASIQQKTEKQWDLCCYSFTSSAMSFKKAVWILFPFLVFLVVVFFLNSSSYSKRLGKSDNEHCTLPRRLQTGVSILWLRSELHSRLPCVRPCSLAENCSPNCICAYLLWYRENDTFGRRCNVLWPKSLYSFGWNVCFWSFSLRFTFFSRLQRTVSEKRLN